MGDERWACIMIHSSQWRSNEEDGGPWRMRLWRQQARSSRRIVSPRRDRFRHTRGSQRVANSTGADEVMEVKPSVTTPVALARPRPAEVHKFFALIFMR